MALGHKSHLFILFDLYLQENPYPAVAMHKLQRPSENSQNTSQNQSPFPVLDEVAVQLFIDHASSKLMNAPPVVKAEIKSMVPSGPPLGGLIVGFKKQTAAFRSSKNVEGKKGTTLIKLKHFVGSTADSSVSDCLVSLQETSWTGTVT